MEGTANYVGWINIYRSGHWHTPGKPGAYNRHGAEVYPSKEDAKAAAAESGRSCDLVATVPVMWYEPETGLKPNPKENPCT